MKIKVGDKVKFLNDTGSGEVTRIVDQKTALVQIEGGFEVPWMISDLVVDKGSYSSDFEEEEEVKPVASAPAFSEKIESSDTPVAMEDEEVVLAFLPDDTSAKFETYLINSSTYHLKYTISRQQEGELVLFHEGTLEAGIKINLGTYKPGNLNDEEYFRIQGLFYNEGFFRHLPPLDLIISVAASEMYKATNRKTNDYFYEKAILHTLYNWKKIQENPPLVLDAEEIKKAMLTKGDLKENKAEKVSSKTATPKEVDLHIGQLSDNYKSLTNGEIVEIQLTHFRKELNSAIHNKITRIVFIHGVGNGKLKHDIRHILDTEYKKLRYQDASFREYGFGATMVLI